MSKRKIHPFTIPRAPIDAPRSLDASVSSTRPYPRAAELASSAEWADWLQGALRAVLVPAGFAGAMSLAACGLIPGSGGDVEPEGTTPANGTSLQPCDPAAHATPATGPIGASLPDPSPVALGGAPPAVQPIAQQQITPPPDSLRTPGEAPPVAMQPPAPTPTPPPAPIPPPQSPPHIRGRVASTGTE